LPDSGIEDPGMQEHKPDEDEDQGLAG